MSNDPMRIVSNHPWQEFASTPQETLDLGANLDAMTQLPGMPDIQTRGVFRGTQEKQSDTDPFDSDPFDSLTRPPLTR